MAKVYVSEYARGTLENRGRIASGEEPCIATTVLDTAGTHITGFLNTQTRFVRIHTDGIISYKFGAAPVAAVTDARMAANATEYFGIPAAPAGGAASLLKIDVIANT